MKRYRRLLPPNLMYTFFQLKAKSLQRDIHPLQEKGGHATVGEIKKNEKKERKEWKKEEEEKQVCLLGSSWPWGHWMSDSTHFSNHRGGHPSPQKEIQ